MNELEILKFNGVEVADSRQVAEVVEKEHHKLLRDIRTYCDYLTESKIGLSDFFIESTYTDQTGRTLPCYLITRKGCEMIANKMTGQKGVIFTAKYVNAFHKMEQQLKGQNNSEKIYSFNVVEAHTRLEMSQQLLKIAENMTTFSKEYKEILLIKSAELLTGEKLISLPQVTQKMYTATEIGKMYGVTAQRIGILSNQYHLKTAEYGAWYKDKARHSDKEVDTFKYNEQGVAKFGELLKN